MTTATLDRVLYCPTCGRIAAKLPSELWQARVADPVEVTCKGGHVHRLRDLLETDPRTPRR